MGYTHTGSFQIGFRRSRSEWQQNLDCLIDFAKAQKFHFIDTGPVATETFQRILASGLDLGCVDLKQWPDLSSPNREKRSAAVDVNLEHVGNAVKFGVGTFLGVMAAEDAARPRQENFDFAVDGWGRLARGMESLGARIALEGWPGTPPHFGTIGCTPADCRAVFRAIASPALCINYDPSHLVRMGIDPVRFLQEFAPRIVHVHAKDTLMPADERYDHGTLQSATFTPPHKWGGNSWRYTLPGCGDVPWNALIQTLITNRYEGKISIELEDEEYSGTEAAEVKGLLLARDFLERL